MRHRGYLTSQNVHIIVDLDLGEQGDHLGLQTESDVTTAVTARALDALPVLDTGHDDVDELPEEMQHGLAAELGLDGDGVTAGGNAPGGHAGLGLEGVNARVGDGLYGHSSDVQPRRVLLRGLLDVAVNRDALQLGDVVEGDGLAQETQHVTTARPAQRPVLVVRRGLIPRAETRRLRRRLEARWVVHVAEGEDVRGDGRVVGLVDARERERAGDVETR